jgi:hypothetical protein
MPIPQAAKHVSLGVFGSFGKYTGRMDGDYPVIDWGRVYELRALTTFFCSSIIDHLVMNNSFTSSEHLGLSFFTSNDTF